MSPRRAASVARAAPADRAAADIAGTREKILDCAARLYSRHGYNEGSIRNIAAAIGIRGPSLYHHFASKEEITIELLRIAAQTVQGELAAVYTRAPDIAGEALLDAAIGAHLSALSHPKRYLAALVRIYGELPPGLREVATRELSPYLKKWIEILRSLAPGGDIDVTEVQAFFIFGAMDSVQDWHYGRRAKRFAREDLRKILKALLLRGLRG